MDNCNVGLNPKPRQRRGERAARGPVVFTRGSALLPGRISAPDLNL